MSEVKIVMSTHGRGEVFIDGTKVPDVTGVEMAVTAGGRNELTIKIIPTTVEVSGVYDVTTIEDKSERYANRRPE